jgi:putative membrane protein
MMMGGFGGMGSWGLFGGLFSLVLTVGLLGGLVFLGVWLWRQYGPPTDAGPEVPFQGTRQSSAFDILQTRYARGELTREEYQMMLQDLA